MNDINDVHKLYSKQYLINKCNKLSIPVKPSYNRKAMYELIRDKEYENYKIANKKQKEEWAKNRKEYKPLQRKKYTDKRYKITRKVFLQSAYIADDVIYVDDYMKDYILNPLFTIESTMYNYYLHSIYDTKDKKYITEIIV